MSTQVTNGGMLGAGAIGAVGSLASTALGYFLGNSASKKQFKHQAALMNLQYKLQQKNYKEAPTAQRQGLEDAGYNPILAVNNGMNYSNPGLGSASGVDYGSSDLPGSMANAVQTFKLNKDQVQSQTALNRATADKTNAERLLTDQRTITETVEQELKRAEIQKTVAEYVLKDKEANWYDKKMAQDILESNSRIKLNSALGSSALTQAVASQISAGASASQASSAQQIADFKQKQAEQEILRNSADAEWVRKHPKLAEIAAGMDRFATPIGKVFHASASYSRSNSKSHVKSESKSYSVVRSKSTSHNHNYKH